MAKKHTPQEPLAGKIFGYDWEDIQRAQQGGRLSRPVVPSDGISKLQAEADDEALAQFGVQGLVDRGFFGVIDRLRRSGKIQRESYR